MFTAQEKAEVLKTVLASKRISEGVQKLALIVKNNPAGGNFGGDVRQLSFSIGPAIEQMFWLNRAIQNLLWVFETNNTQRKERSVNLADAYGLLDSIIRQLDEVAGRCAPIPAYAPAGIDFSAASVLLRSFDRLLTYFEPFPSSYPRIIGPHGHYELAQGAAALSTKYLVDTQMRLNRIPEWPNEQRSNVYMGIVFDNLAKSFHSWNRIMAMQGEVILPEDDDTAQFDFEASSGLRPKSFFIALIAHELAMTRTDTVVFSGREAPGGIASYFRDLLDALGKTFSEVGKLHPELLVDENGSDGGVFFTMAQTWSALDQWSEANLGFFFDIPAPPVIVDPSQNSVIKPGFFNQEVALLEEMISEVQQVRASLLNKEGKPV